MNKFLTALLLSATLALQGCASFKAERLSTAEGDEKAMEITDEWLLQSLHDRLISKKQDIKERELTRPYSPPNRGRSR